MAAIDYLEFVLKVTLFSQHRNIILHKDLMWYIILSAYFEVYFNDLHCSHWTHTTFLFANNWSVPLQLFCCFCFPRLWEMDDTLCVTNSNQWHANRGKDPGPIHLPLDFDNETMQVHDYCGYAKENWNLRNAFQWCVE